MHEVVKSDLDMMCDSKKEGFGRISGGSFSPAGPVSGALFCAGCVNWNALMRKTESIHLVVYDNFVEGCRRGCRDSRQIRTVAGAS
jgi:hypothetical protein